jgi:hypothetical protein
MFIASLFEEKEIFLISKMTSSCDVKSSKTEKQFILVKLYNKNKQECVDSNWTKRVGVQMFKFRSVFKGKKESKLFQGLL